MNRTIAIMQPYLFPYIGYFQLIHAVDVFVFYDDVNFIKKGWVNRNKLWVNGKEYRFTVPLKKVSQNKMICDVMVLKDENWLLQFFSTLQHYRKAPYFKDVLELLRSIFQAPYTSIADLSIESVKQIADYLMLPTKFEISSQHYGATRTMEKADRLIAIAKKRGIQKYINLSGGKPLYDKSYFSKQGIELIFMENELISYPQFGQTSLTGLSIIDVLMFNSKEATLQLIEQYKLV